MTLLEFAEKTSQTPLTAWQREFLTMYEQAVKDGAGLTVNMVPNVGRKTAVDIINQLHGSKSTEVYCQGTKKIGIPCKRYLGKVEGKAELLCPICKTLNVVEDGKITVKEEYHEDKRR